MKVVDDRAPALFLSHGSPMAALQEDDYTAALRAFGQLHPDPKAIIIVSAHWVTAGPVQVNFDPKPALIYDFEGFPESLYSIDYGAKGSTEVALYVTSLLGEAGIASVPNRERGWDHGVWIPLRLMYPDAKFPVVQLSLPIAESPREILWLGHALSKLREEGAMLVGSGGLVHNLRRLQWAQKDAMVNLWASNFAAWTKERLERAEIEKLLDFERAAPEARTAHPTVEHFLPLFFVAGASMSGDRVRPVFDGFQYGNLSMFCFSLEP